MSFRSLVAVSTDKLSNMNGSEAAADMGKGNIRIYHGNLATIHILQASNIELKRQDLIELNAVNMIYK